ncbi:hypothetical protein GN244_ATG14478 [Phytophthora infestans]|uniref:Uncharacterized protein n=1 Tax=Phytophthora infestans TaxID=4787 RepID=A0A833SV32_PHYIN|nr:hypothetical protein GN244_ATG14478 [Phytophthora infestans]
MVAGAWQFIDSVQVVIDGTTVQTNQAITETDYNTYVKHGPTSSFVLDEYDTTIIQGSSGAAQSLENLATSSFMTVTYRIAAERSLFTALDQQSSKLAFDVMGGSAIFKPYRNPKSMWLLLVLLLLARHFTSRYLACIKLLDICDYF